MIQATPRIEIDLRKIAHNARSLVSLYGSKGISLMGVTKGVCGHPDIASILVQNGIRILADSRIEHIKRMRQAGINASFMLLRIPASTQIQDVVQYADLSLNTEISVIQALSHNALESGKVHKIILMVELGDLREGILPQDLESVVSHTQECSGVKLVGLGANLACFAGVKPDQEKMRTLSSLAQKLEHTFQIHLEIVSGGNSANYSWFVSTPDLGRINNLRVGESMFLGCETLYRHPLPGLYTDAFSFIAEVIESKIKPSLPQGDLCQDASGSLPRFQDKGLIRRAICNIGWQDVQVSGLTPLLNVEILGATSDHLILDAKDEVLSVGDEIPFALSYKALSTAMASPYVTKKGVS